MNYINLLIMTKSFANVPNFMKHTVHMLLDLIPHFYTGLQLLGTIDIDMSPATQVPRVPCCHRLLNVVQSTHKQLVTVDVGTKRHYT